MSYNWFHCHSFPTTDILDPPDNTSLTFLRWPNSHSYEPISYQIDWYPMWYCLWLSFSILPRSNNHSILQTQVHSILSFYWSITNSRLLLRTTPSGSIVDYPKVFIISLHFCLISYSVSLPPICSPIIIFIIYFLTRLRCLIQKVIMFNKITQYF